MLAWRVKYAVVRYDFVCSPVHETIVYTEVYEDSLREVREAIPTDGDEDWTIIEAHYLGETVNIDVTSASDKEHQAILDIKRYGQPPHLPQGKN